MLMNEGRANDAFNAMAPVLAAVSALTDHREASGLNAFPPPPVEEVAVAARHLLATYESMEGFALLLCGQCFEAMGLYDVVGARRYPDHHHAHRTCIVLVDTS